MSIEQFILLKTRYVVHYTTVFYTPIQCGYNCCLSVRHLVSHYFTTY